MASEGACEIEFGCAGHSFYQNFHYQLDSGAFMASNKCPESLFGTQFEVYIFLSAILFDWNYQCGRWGLQLQYLHVRMQYSYIDIEIAIEVRILSR